MEEIQIAGTVLLPIGPTITRVEYVFWRDRAWLAPMWITSPNGTMRPIRLIAPRFAAGADALPGSDVLNLFQRMPLAQATLDQGFIPGDMAAILHIVENPDVFARTPAAG